MQLGFSRYDVGIRLRNVSLFCEESFFMKELPRRRRAGCIRQPEFGHGLKELFQLFLVHEYKSGAKRCAPDPAGTDCISFKYSGGPLPCREVFTSKVSNRLSGFAFCVRSTRPPHWLI